MPVPEDDVFFLLALPVVAAADTERTAEILRGAGGDFDWGRLVDLGLRNRVLPLIGRNVVRYGALRSAAQRHHGIARDMLAAVYLGNRCRNDALFGEFGRVIGALRVADVRHAVRKGPALIEHHYVDRGVRQTNDLDLLVSRDDIPVVREVLDSLGYTQGKVAATGRGVSPFQRSTELLWKAYLNNSLPFVKAAFTDEIDYFKVDLCHGLLQTRQASGDSAAQLLAQARPAVVCGERSWVLDPVDAVLDLCAHLHKEANGLRYIRSGKAFELRKFNDLVVSTAAWDNADWLSLTERATALNATVPCFYALAHLTSLYPGVVPEKHLEQLRPDQADQVLDGYGAEDQAPAQWTNSLRDRLLSGVDHTTIPRSPIPED